jgi:hypothetical protein
VDPIPGWLAADLPGRRRPELAISDLLATVGQQYRARFRQLLTLAILIEGPGALASLAVLVAQIDQSRRALSTGMVPVSPENPFSRIDPAFAVVWTGISVLPWLAVVVMHAATASFITRPAEPGHLRWIAQELRRRWRGLLAVFLLPVLVSLVAVIAIVFIGFSATGPDEAIRNPGGAIASALLLLVGTAVLVVGGIYLMVRWSVTVPVLMTDGLGLRGAVARSAELTRGQRVRVALLLLTVSILVGLAAAPAGVATVLLAFGGDVSPAVFGLFAASFLCGRVVVAPVLPLTLVALREELMRPRR